MEWQGIDEPTIDKLLSTYKLHFEQSGLSPSEAERFIYDIYEFGVKETVLSNPYAGRLISREERCEIRLITIDTEKASHDFLEEVITALSTLLIRRINVLYRVCPESKRVYFISVKMSF